MTYIKRIHKHTTNILKYAVLALSVTLTATLQAETDPKQSQVQKLSNKQIQCLVLNSYMESKLDKCVNMMYYLILIED